jgi:hypothetical protein
VFYVSALMNVNLRRHQYKVLLSGDSLAANETMMEYLVVICHH